MRVSRRFAAYRPSFARRLNDESRRRPRRVSVVQLQCVGRRSIAIRTSIASALKTASDLISREPNALSRAEGPWPSAVFTIAEQAPVARTNGRGGRVRAEPARGAMRGAGVVQGAAGGRIAEEKYPVLLAQTRGKLETTSMPRPYGAEFHSA